MQRCVLGKSDLLVSRLGFGCWQLGGHGWAGSVAADLAAAVEKASELGVTFFDTADVYGLGTSERLLSEILGDARHDAVIATKFGVRVGEDGRSFRDNSLTHMRYALKGSLERLRLDTVPLYQAHWPDGLTPLPALLDQLERLRGEGLIRWYGLSNFPTADLELAAQYPGFVTAQFSYNLIEAPDKESVRAVCERRGIAGVTHSSLAQGLLGGRRAPAGGFGADDVRSRSEFFSLEANARIADEVEACAGRLGATPAQIALQWVLSQPGISVALCGCRTPRQAIENFGSSVELPTEEIARLTQASHRRHEEHHRT